MKRIDKVHHYCTAYTESLSKKILLNDTDIGITQNKTNGNYNSMRSLGQEKRGGGGRNKESFIYTTQLFSSALTIKQVERDSETEGLFNEAMVTEQGMHELD